MNKFLNFLIVIFLVIFCFSGYKLGSYAWHTHQTKQTSRELAGLIREDSSGDTITVTGNGEPSTDPSAASKPAAKEELRAAMMKKYGALYDRNSDFVGWLAIEDTDISYPVMQTPDDPEKYLEMNFNREFDNHGTLFVDARCSLDPETVNTDTIIYGHHMKDGTMFGSLPSFEDADYCSAHSEITFDTLYRPGTYKLFAVILDQAAEIGSEHEEDIYYNFIDAQDETALQTYLENMQKAAVYYDAENEPKYGDEILTLSTCNYHVTDGRLALIAVRVE